jgi:hypothetical protein
VSRGRSNACNPLAPRIDKNLGNPVVKRCRSVHLRIVGGYIFYPSTVSILKFHLKNLHKKISQQRVGYHLVYTRTHGKHYYHILRATAPPHTPWPNHNPLPSLFCCSLCPSPNMWIPSPSLSSGVTFSQVPPLPLSFTSLLSLSSCHSLLYSPSVVPSLSFACPSLL